MFRENSVPLTGEALVSPPANPEMNGRLALQDTPYLLPSTRGEAARMNDQHTLFHAITARHILALPALELPAHAHILDSGCGQDAIWLRDVLRERPDLRAVGVDLHVPSTLEEIAPVSAAPASGSLRLIAGDVLRGLPFADDLFDYTHQRQLCAAIPMQSWRAVVSELVRVTRPGGWIELVEAGPIHSIPPICPAIRELDQLTNAYGRLRGINLSMTRHLPELLRETGQIVASTLRYYDFPVALGECSKPWGASIAANWLTVRRAMGPTLIQASLVDEARYEEYLIAAQHELHHAKVPWPVHVAYAQRL